MRPVLLLLAMGCSNAPIDDGARFGPFTQVKTFFTSSFVAETSDGVVLVDSGFSRNASPIAAHLEERGLGLEDVRHVVITHGHSDHVRALDQFVNATLWAHEDEVPLITEEAPEGVSVDETVTDGALLEFGELSMEVLHTPGHTPGNLVLLSEGILLMGDTAMSFKDGTVGPAPERYSEDAEQARTGLLELRDRLEPRREEISAVVFAHSEGLTDMAPFWDMTEASLQRSGPDREHLHPESIAH